MLLLAGQLRYFNIGGRQLMQIGVVVRMIFAMLVIAITMSLAEGVPHDQRDTRTS